jgi:glycosyltransferase involved in cell wall biosynthesis
MSCRNCRYWSGKFLVMRILWILPYLPWPTTSGGKTRQYHLLRALAARGHRITLLAQSKTPLDEASRAELESFLEKLIVLPRRALKHPLTLAAALFAPYPLLASVNGLAPRASAVFAELLATTSWDIVQIEHSYTFQPYEKALRQHRRDFLLTEHNVESTLGAATYKRLPFWLRPLARFDRWRYHRWEKRVFAQAGQLMAVTPEDAETLARIAGKPVRPVANAVDCAQFAANLPDRTSQRLIFVGNYEYSPNVDAVHWLLEGIMPRLWQRCPGARLGIYGYAMPQAWPLRWTDSRCEWHGFVADLREAQRHAAIFIAPLKSGGGSKLKVLEALAGGLPLVSTAQGVSGLQLEAGRDYLAGETAETLAKAAARLLDDTSQAAVMGESGRRYVQAKHDWQNIAQQLEAFYQQHLAQKAEGLHAHRH